jgi:3-phenylpropionate/trans-cinnamate dioxygenase ferredoxin reductase component
MHAPRVAIVGAGFIGLEVAASCRARGLHVTVIESLPAPLSPSLGPTICEMVAAIHCDHGVDLRTGVAVTEVFGESRVAGVALSDGSRIDANVVVVGIGVTPNTEWLEGSGLTLDNGIVCNGSGEAAPDVYAAGDVARVANRWHGDSPRIEHWTNAVAQAVHVAENALAGPAAGTSFSSAPYFWSDQYDRKIQFIGRVRPHDEMVIVDGSLADRRLTALYRHGNRVVACLAVNQPRALIKYRKLLAGGATREAAMRNGRFVAHAPLASMASPERPPAQNSWVGTAATWGVGRFEPTAENYFDARRDFRSANSGRKPDRHHSGPIWWTRFSVGRTR